MTALPASALHLELFEKRNEIPIDFKTGPDHQINSTPGWICQIYCDDFGEANDGDKASTYLFSICWCSNWGYTYKLPKTSMIAIKILWYKGTLSVQMYGRGMIIRPKSLMIPPIATPT
jgi:hypothetical protein